jgi:hypothetical protein
LSRSAHFLLWLSLVTGFIPLSSPPASAQSETLEPLYLETMRQQSLAADAIGDFKLHAGDPAGARSAYLEGLALARRILAAEPSNSQWQADVVVSLWKLATVTTERSVKISILREALGSVAELEARGALKSNQRGWRAMIEGEIAKPAAETNPEPHQHHRRSAGVADGFTARQH